MFSPLLYQLSYLAKSEGGGAKEARGLTSTGIPRVVRPLQVFSAWYQMVTHGNRHAVQARLESGVDSRLISRFAGARPHPAGHVEQSLDAFLAPQSRRARVPNP
jgi:hypothetical protein